MTIGKTFTAPDGKMFRPSIFLTPTCASYGKIGADGTAADTPAGHARHDPAVASPPGHTQADLSAPDGPAAGQRRDCRADRATRNRA